ncbi:protein ESSENTIAL FOR POTEXVIRUS ACCUMULATION 1 [Silene latifolia]|uniref:protein ESSENTIAL FOR POTEXVIRUS ACCUMULATION 1 n=1 Tax=Silene latifolia TaxID=37657 RepID=UPI003D77536D
MASFDSRTQISNDKPGSDNAIPLSPQWLLPKPGENKSGTAQGETHANPFTGSGDRPDVIKSPGNGDEMQENQKKKDVFRPTFLDMESRRRDHWRDEERDTNQSVRKDRWREGDKEIVDNRKNARWVDNSPAKHIGEARRTPTDRWADPSRDAHHDQRSDIKRNTRWGPGDKEMDKWTDAGKYDGMPFDKGPSHLSNHGKDEKEGDHSRPWRPSFLQGRGRADPSHHHTQMAGKEVPTYNHGRGRGDNAPPTFSAGRGKVAFGSGGSSTYSGHLQSSGFMPERGDNGLGEPSPFRYNRTKLLDILRLTDLRSSSKILDGLTLVPSLTQEEPLQPLALCVPTSEESGILKGIDKGEIVSSGAPQISKDGSSGRRAVDFETSRHRKLGSKEDLSSASDDASEKFDNASGASLPIEKLMHPSGSNITLSNTDYQKPYTENRYNMEAVRDEVLNNRDATIKGHVSTKYEAPWRPAAAAQPPLSPSPVEKGWAQEPKDRPNGWENISPYPSYAHNEVKWQGGENSTPWKHSSAIDVQPSPEDLSLVYKDPQGLIQGPFSGSDIIGWFEAGYFGIDLQVRLASASHDLPFSLLGDVMPHLRAKARPPPGFNSAKHADVIDMPIRSSSSGSSNILPSGVNSIGGENRLAHGSATEAENRFLESLMSSDIGTSLESFVPKEGMQGIKGHISSGMPAVGAESGDVLSLLAKRMNFEQHKSIPNPYPYWPPRDSLPVPSPDLNKDKIDVPHGHNFSQAMYSLQQQKLQPPNQPSNTNVYGQTLDIQGILAEKLLASGVGQDPQLLNLLQQQYLLQLQSQQTLPSPQLSMLDRVLLLQHQQKQEEQQKLLLSKFLSEQQHFQRFGDPSIGQMQASAQLVGNSPNSSPAPQLLNQFFQVNPQIPISSMLDDRNANTANMLPKAPLDMSRTISFEGSSSLPLPHQMLGNLPEGGPSVPAHANDTKFNISSPGSAMYNFATSEAMENSSSIRQTLQRDSETVEPALGAEYEIGANHRSSTRDGENVSLKPELSNDVEIIHNIPLEETPLKDSIDEVSTVNDGKNIESREVKKTSEKKSKKQKSLKAQPSSDQVKATLKGTSVQHSKQSEDLKVTAIDQSEVGVLASGTLSGPPMHKAIGVLSSQDELLVSANLPGGAFESDTKGDESKQGKAAQRAWKPAVSVKPKSLLEIQQEEQRRAQMEIPVPDVSASVSSMTVTSPWVGVVPTDSKVTREIGHDSSNTDDNIGMPELSKIKKSGLHDLLAAEVAKSSERNIEVSASSLPPLPTMSKQIDMAIDDNFTEAKDSKKSRKKAAKAKGATVKASAKSSADVTVASSPVEKGKLNKLVQVEKEVLPTPPSGPSLGDFVPWKEESTSPSPAPAWLAEPPKFPKPTSLRDILREQEKKVTPVQQHSQISTPQKPQSTQTRGGSRSIIASSPSKSAAPVQISSEASFQSKYNAEDDFFWGPPEQSKQESKQADFPRLGNHGSPATKSTSGASLSRQKSGGGKALQQVSSQPASSQVSVKGKKGNGKRSEAVDFRDWCESESARLTGSKDTSFLEFCLKQSKSEAEALLRENLGSFDPNHEFIEKFLNYKEMLPADVLETAFQSQNDQKAYNDGAKDVISDYGVLGDSAKGGKKKGKKGKKVSPSVLGFNVVSNRIMMGEIQTLED